MKELLSIGKLAKLTNTTIETLRHYDKKGILKPNVVDNKTGYRYYSILQYHTLITILELREIGMSIDDIKNYIDNQTISTSLELFESQSKNIKHLIGNLRRIDKDISSKIQLLNKFKDVVQSEDIEFKHIDERRIVTTNTELKNEDEVTYEFLEFDLQVKNKLPTLVPCGFFINQDNDFNSSILFFIVDDLKIKSQNLITLEENLFACAYHKGGYGEIYKFIPNILEKLANKGYTIIGKTILLPHIEAPLTQLESEHLYEIQIPVKKS